MERRLTLLESLDPTPCMEVLRLSAHQDVSELGELGPHQWLGEQICPHVSRVLVLENYLRQLNKLVDPKVAHGNML